VGAIFFKIIYIQELKPAQAGLVWVATGFNPLRFRGVGWGAHGLGCPQYPRVETRGYIDKTRLRGFGWWVGAIFLNVIYIQLFKPAQAGFVWVATGFNPLRFGVVGFLVPTGWGAHGYPRVETPRVETPRVSTRGYIDKTRLRGFGWLVGAIFFNVTYIQELKPAQAGFIWVAIGFNLWRFGVVGFLVPTGWGAHGYPRVETPRVETPRVETRGYIDKTRLRGLGW